MTKRQRENEFKSRLIKAGIKEAGKAIYNYMKQPTAKRPRVRMRVRGRTKALTQKALNTSKKNRRDIKKMKCFINTRTAMHVHRTRRAGNVKCSPGQANVNGFALSGSISAWESQGANLRFYNPATNALVTQSLYSGTYSREVCLTVYRKLKVRNNYQVPCSVEVWECRPKNATSITAYTAWVNGLADQNNPSQTSPLVHITDSRDLKQIWNVKRLCKRTLQPGKQCTVRSNSKKFDYNIATADEHTLAYQKKWGGHNFLIRVTGEIGHDTIAAEYGTLEAGVDYLFESTTVFEYDAGKDLLDYSIDDTTATSFTNSGVVSLQPTADNIAESRA